MLYFSGFKCFKKIIPNNKKLNIIYEQGSKKIDKYSKIINIIKDLRRLKMASSVNIDGQLNFEFEHT